MARKFLLSGDMGARRTKLPNGNGARFAPNRHIGGIRHQPETDLPTSGQLDIDLGKKLGIKQCAVLHAMAAIDSETHTEGVETVFRSRMLVASKRKRIDHPAHANSRSPAAFELEVQKAEIERGVVRDKRRILDKVEQVLDPL